MPAHAEPHAAGVGVGVGVGAAEPWGYCSWCGSRDGALVDGGPRASWACAEHWPAAAGPFRPVAAEPVWFAGLGPAKADRDAPAYWERPYDDPAPTARDLERRADLALRRELAHRRGGGRDARDRALREREDLRRELGAHRAVEAARDGGTWVPLGYLPPQQ